MIVIKRVYDAPAPEDGRRILVDRLWPRGLTKAAAALDDWAKEVAPSTELRQEFNHDPAKFTWFTNAYRKELEANPAASDLRRQIAGKSVTLLYAAKDPQINHAVVLKAYLVAA